MYGLISHLYKRFKFLYPKRKCALLQYREYLV